MVVSAESMRALSFKRANARPGEKDTGALVIFQASEIREATADERKQLQAARKSAKLKAKAARAKRAEEKRVAKEREALQQQHAVKQPA